MKTMNKVMMVVSVGLVVAAGASVLDRDEPREVANNAATAPAESAIASADHAATRRATRIFRIAAQNPGLRYDEAETFVEQSDQMREQVQDAGETDLGDAIRQRLAEVEIDEGEAVAWFQANREIFGSRSFEQSRHTVERLMAIERVREEFALL
ncbi:MAG: hypothetical protein AAGF11_28800 [Myxococcota bacterium]